MRSRCLSGSSWARVMLVVLSLLALTSIARTSNRGVASPDTHAAGRGGGVASAEPAASRAGLQILSAGGNAVDASIAVALALAVVHPQAGNLGGGGFALIRGGEQIAALDFRETAPAAARPDMYRDPAGKPLADASWIGPLAAGVPGSPAGLYELHRRFGRLPWKDIVAPSIRLARDGFTVTPRLRDALAEEHETLARFPETVATWLPGGKAPDPGTIMRLPDLAATLSAYAARGPSAITSGPLASALALASRARGGVLTAADLASYRPEWRNPLRFRAFGWEIAGMPLPSSGGIILAETCALLERLGWADLPKDGADRAHLLVESWRRAYADRFVLGDPSTTMAGPGQLLEPSWIRLRAESVDPLHATPSLQVRPWPGAKGSRIGARAGEAPETTHLSVVDATGEMVALTTTLNGWFGCGLLVPGAGFFLNNEMDDFTTAPDVANAYGLVQGEANAVRPGKRMLSSMSPTIAWKGDEAIAIGSPGGSRIPTATLQVLLRLIVDGEPLERAVERPRLHHQWLPDEIAIEDGALTPGVRAELERRGHTLKVTSWRIGEIDAIVRHAGGTLEAEADGRGPGGAGVTVPADPSPHPPVCAEKPRATVGGP